MSKILTAIDNEKILKKIRKNKITNKENILYKEAIIDIIEKNKKIDIIIISEKIPGEINIIKLIKKIKKINNKIKIIIILSNKKSEEKFKKINIKDIYFENIISINKLIKKLKPKEKKYLNKNIKKYILNKIKKILKIKIEKIINNKENKNNKKNGIIIFGKNKIDKKIIELIIIKKLINKHIKIIIINLNLKNKKKKIKNKINNINNIKNINKNKYYLKIKINYKLKEKIILKNVKEIININRILNKKNNLIKIKILNQIIKKYNKNNYYILINLNSFDLQVLNKIPKIKKYINILVYENNKKSLLELNEYKLEKEKSYLIINNYKKNNLSKYFYKIFLKNKFKKIKLLNFK